MLCGLLCRNSPSASTRLEVSLKFTHYPNDTMMLLLHFHITMLFFIWFVSCLTTYKTTQSNINNQITVYIPFVFTVHHRLSGVKFRDTSWWNGLCKIQTYTRMKPVFITNSCLSRPSNSFTFTHDQQGTMHLLTFWPDCTAGEFHLVASASKRRDATLGQEWNKGSLLQYNWHSHALHEKIYWLVI